MLRKSQHYNHFRAEPASPASHALEREGHVLLESVFAPDEVVRLREDVDRVFREYAPDGRVGAPALPQAEWYRYVMFERSPVVHAAIEHPRILEAIEPLLGEDCHVIANTSWRNPPERASAPDGLQWHVDGGPHVVRPPGTEWPSEIPYPIFVVTAQIYLQEVRHADGPTAILPGSHRSGALPPDERKWDVDLTYEGRGAEVHTAAPGDVSLFVSDTWHRRMPQHEETRGRDFVQCIYARREIAQRLVPTDEGCAVGDEARTRAVSLRQRQLIGLHEACFYDG